MPVNPNRIGFAVGAALLGSMFLVPVWQIALGIPQYPKKLEVNIWMHKLENGTPKALEIINVLNHNIGMEEVKQEDLPELRIFPVVLSVLIGLGVASAFLNTTFQKVWLSLLVLCCILAMVDFYTILHDLSHNLAADAPIKLENQSFQPPLIGSKMVSNFKVYSIPQIGAVIPVLSFLTASYFTHKLHSI